MLMMMLYLCEVGTILGKEIFLLQCFLSSEAVVCEVIRKGTSSRVAEPRGPGDTAAPQ